MKTITNITWSNIPENTCNECYLKEWLTVNFIYNGIELEAEVETYLYFDIYVDEGDNLTPANITDQLKDIEMDIIEVWDGDDDFYLKPIPRLELEEFLINDLKTYY